MARWKWVFIAVIRSVIWKRWERIQTASEHPMSSIAANTNKRTFQHFSDLLISANPISCQDDTKGLILYKKWALCLTTTKKNTPTAA